LIFVDISLPPHLFGDISAFVGYGFDLEVQATAIGKTQFLKDFCTHFIISGAFRPVQFR